LYLTYTELFTVKAKMMMMQMPRGWMSRHEIHTSTLYATREKKRRGRERGLKIESGYRFFALLGCEEEGDR
jgi:hypothetical protein